MKGDVVVLDNNDAIDDSTLLAVPPTVYIYFFYIYSIFLDFFNHIYKCWRRKFSQEI